MSYSFIGLGFAMSWALVISCLHVITRRPAQQRSVVSRVRPTVSPPMWPPWSNSMFASPPASPWWTIMNWQQKVARWNHRMFAQRTAINNSTYASFQETPSLHAKGILGYLNSMYFSILYEMHMGRKQILRGFSVFSRPIFLICVCVGNVKRFV